MVSCLGLDPNAIEIRLVDFRWNRVDKSDVLNRFINALCFPVLLRLLSNPKRLALRIPTQLINLQTESHWPAPFRAL
jgi:hypothetical protein